MAIDEGIAQMMREDLGEIENLQEKKMFGGLAFMLNGHMLCGVHSEKYGGGVMYRVGKDREAEGLAVKGAGPMQFTGRPMGGMIDLDADALTDEDSRHALLDLSLAFVRSLPPK